MSTHAFSSWFRHECARRDWNQTGFHTASGVPKSTVSSWWRGIRVPDPAQCERIAETLNVDLDYVLVMAGHRPNIENLKPDDPRTDLIAMIRRVDWNAERERYIRLLLDAMPKRR